MKMIRLVRRKDALGNHGFDWATEIWALDTPRSRAALLLLLSMANARHGAGSHEIVERESDKAEGVRRGLI